MACLDEAKRVHLIGIGGCSMSGIAQILLSQGHIVTGSDREPSQFTEHLASLGIPVSIGHKPEQVGDANLVIYSAAIKPDNPERAFAREHGIPELERSVALGQISERFSDVVAVAGCHGKTTITSMLAHVNEHAGLDATVHVGGYVDLLDGGVRVGRSDLFITEACEYVESFLTLRPTIAVINNIDNDHLDYYHDFDHIVGAFFRFAALIPPEGLVIGCVDDPEVEKLLHLVDRRSVTYGLDRGDIHAADITYDDNGCPSFTLVAFDKPLARVALSVPGTHNVTNALAVYAVVDALHAPLSAYTEAIRAFTNTKRRFELLGEKDGVRVFHDYGHHPSEIAATLEAASRVPHGKLFCVFQCNSYTRARTLFCENVNCFRLADEVLVPDIYPGRETDTGIVHAKDMVDAINLSSHNAKYLGTFENIRDYLAQNARPGDMVLTVGSGDVYRKSRLFVE